MIDTLVPSAGASTADEFIRRTMHETGCPRAVAHTALRLIMRRHRPQMGRLHRYLARFTPADRAHWVEQALATERATLASILIGEFAEQRSVGRAVSTADADHAMLARARSSNPDGARPRGLALLDAALREMSQGSPGAAAAIAAVSARPSVDAAVAVSARASAEAAVAVSARPSAEAAVAVSARPAAAAAIAAVSAAAGGAR